MTLPYVKETEKNVTFIQEFTGYNHNLRCGQGQFFDMENMTGDYAPVLSTRSLRSQLSIIPDTPQAIFCKDYIYYIAGGNLVWGIIDGNVWKQKGTILSAFTSGEKKIADIGAYVLILPDKIIFDSANKTLSDATYYFEDNEWTVSENTVEGLLKITPCKLEGDPITYTASATAPSNTSVYWLNTTTKTVNFYNEADNAWEQLDNVYLKVEPYLDYNPQTGAGTDASTWLNNFQTQINKLNAYDTVYLEIDDADESYGVLTGDTVIMYRGDGFIVIGGIQPEMFTTTFKFYNRFPDMSYITSLNNRIWGCDKTGHTVYASKLGDATQWYNYAGLSSDSFASTVGSDGDWTGAIAYNNNVLFFKKDKLHRVMGNYPSNFQLAEYTVNGVAEDCSKSLCVVNGYLFYLGEEGVMVYDGSLPRKCSDEFGDMRFKSGVGGQQMNKYYLSAKDANNVTRVFVYDTEKRQWWKEDDTIFEMTCTHFNHLIGMHYIRNNNGNMVHVLVAEVGSYEGTMDWFVETGDLGLNTPYQKYISKIQVRMAFEGTMYVEISYNGGEFKRVLEKTYDSLRSYTVPINVKRCDHFRIRIGGEGVCKIYSMGYNTETGSEIC